MSYVSRKRKTLFNVDEYSIMNKTPYPSIDELLPPLLLAKIPHKLAEEIKERYATLGEKYLTDALHSDGRRINGMMFTDRLVNMNEEITDAVFCVIGQIFKNKKNGIDSSENLTYILDGLIDIYTIASIEIAKGGYA